MIAFKLNGFENKTNNIDDIIKRINLITSISWVSGLLSKADAEKLFNALKNNKTVKILNLEKSYLCEQSLIKLADVIKKNATLEKITLGDGYHEFTDESKIALQKAVKFNKKLKHIGLGTTYATAEAPSQPAPAPASVKEAPKQQVADVTENKMSNTKLGMIMATVSVLAAAAIILSALFIHSVIAMAAVIAVTAAAAVAVEGYLGKKIYDSYARPVNNDKLKSPQPTVAASADKSQTNHLANQANRSTQPTSEIAKS